jgi:micrococcal nuclease
MKLRRYGPLGFLAFVLALFAAFVVAPQMKGEPPAASPANEETVAATSLRIIDGDTLEDTASDTTYRVVNIDTPETGSRARCSNERSLGARATDQVRALVSRAAAIEFRPTGRIDRYGRTIAFVLIDGRDLGEMLIAEGLARPWRGRREPWCAANGDLLP